MTQRTIPDVLHDLGRAYTAQNGPEFHRLVQLLHVAVTPAQEQVPLVDAAVLQPFVPAPLVTFGTTHTPPIDPHLQQIERLLRHGLAYLSAIHAQNRRLLMNAADINAKLDRIDQATNNIAADIRFLITQIQPGMTQADVDAVGARLETSATALETIASANKPPAPTPVPTPGATGATGAPGATTTAAAVDGSTFSGETGAGTTGRVAG